MMEEQLKKELRQCDIFTVICFVMFLIVHLCSMGIFSHISVETKTEITQVTTMYEANPFAKMVIDLGKIGYAIQYIFIPGLAGATYLWFRRRVKCGNTSMESMMFFINFAFFNLLINMVNDASILIGKLI